MAPQTLYVQLKPAPEVTDRDQLADFTALRGAFLELPVHSVKSGQLPPADHSKAAGAIDFTQILVTLLPTTALIGAIAKIVVEHMRTGATKEVHLRVGEDELRLTGITDATQKAALDAWLARVASPGGDHGD